MNILHMRYAVEIAKVGSINKAADILFVAQPNLSRAVKELESDLGIVIFDRSAKGMVLTIEGRQFINYATKILCQIDEVEQMYKYGKDRKQIFSLSAPRSGYISEAFLRLSKNIDSTKAEIFFKETNAWRAVNNILSSDYNLGIVRYAEEYDKYYTSTLEQKGLCIKEIAKFRYRLVVNKNSPLANKDTVKLSELADYIEITNADASIPSLPVLDVKSVDFSSETQKRIYVYERASQFDLISGNDLSFMWVSPVPQKNLDRYGLVEKKCDDVSILYKDVLIYRKDYILSDLDKQFVEELNKTKPEQ